MKQVRRYCLFILLSALRNIFSWLPLGFSLKVGSFLGLFAFFLLRKERAKVIRNLNRAFPKEKSCKEKQKIAREVFKNLGKNLMEWVKLPLWTREEINECVDEVEGLEHIVRALERGRGAIVFTAHFGNWEMMAAYFGANGYPTAVVAKHIYYEKYNDFLVQLRKSHEVGVIYRTESVRKLVAFLKSNKLLGILPDQDITEANGIFVDFFNLPAYTPKGPVVLSMVSGACLIPCFIIRKENNKHRMIIKPAIDLVDTGDKNNDIIENTARWSRAIEQIIIQYPGQWVWMHDRWKTKP